MRWPNLVVRKEEKNTSKQTKTICRGSRKHTNRRPDSPTGLAGREASHPLTRPHHAPAFSLKTPRDPQLSKPAFRGPPSHNMCCQITRAPSYNGRSQPLPPPSRGPLFYPSPPRLSPVTVASRPFSPPRNFLLVLPSSG